MAVLESLETPALVLERAKLAANCRRLRAHLQSSGVAFRPHMKTAKSLEVARLMLGGEPGPITVSTLREAEFFFAHGFEDVLYAVGLTASKIARAQALVRAGCRLRVLLDGVEMARSLREAFRKQGVALPALIEIDT